MTGPDAVPVVTCFLRNGGEVLLLRRSEHVRSYPGLWAGISGYVEGEPDASAWREIAEETGLADSVALVRRGPPLTVDAPEAGRSWMVHPYLFDCTSRSVQVNEESSDAVWVPATEMLRRDTVPQLWAAYARVAPSLDTVRDDRVHGSSYVSMRALEVLRDRAGWLAARGVESESAWSELRELALHLLDARRSMTALVNRINRTMYVCRNERTASAVEAEAHRAIAAATQGDRAAAHQAARLVAGRRVLTLSYSDTVIEAILHADPPPSVVVAESRPGGEGVGVALKLQEAGIDVTLVADAAVAAVLADKRANLLVVGADAVLPSGSVVNKVGTRSAALAARQETIPCFAVSARDKISTEEAPRLESAPKSDLYQGDPPLKVLNPLFDVTPFHLITGIVTESGSVKPGDVRDIAVDFEGYRDW
jgi:ribose 1,5-bisphosphate isomerase